MAPSGWEPVLVEPGRELQAGGRSLHFTAPAQSLLLFFGFFGVLFLVVFLLLLFLPEIWMLKSSQRRDGSAALPAPETLPGAVSEHFQELLVILSLPVNFF